MVWGFSDYGVGPGTHAFVPLAFQVLLMYACLLIQQAGLFNTGIQAG